METISNSAAARDEGAYKSDHTKVIMRQKLLPSIYIYIYIYKPHLISLVIARLILQNYLSVGPRYLFFTIPNLSVLNKWKFVGLYTVTEFSTLPHHTPRTPLTFVTVLLALLPYSKGTPPALKWLELSHNTMATFNFIKKQVCLCFQIDFNPSYELKEAPV